MIRQRETDDAAAARIATPVSDKALVDALDAVFPLRTVPNATATERCYVCAICFPVLCGIAGYPQAIKAPSTLDQGIYTPNLSSAGKPSRPTGNATGHLKKKHAVLLSDSVKFIAFVDACNAAGGQPSAEMTLRRNFYHGFATSDEDRKLMIIAATYASFAVVQMESVRHGAELERGVLDRATVATKMAGFARRLSEFRMRSIVLASAATKTAARRASEQRSVDVHLVQEERDWPRLLVILRRRERRHVREREKAKDRKYDRSKIFVDEFVFEFETTFFFE